MSRKEKGATALDRLCHTLYDVPKGAGFLATGQCQGCGGSLMTYYCEERLYLIVCQKCGAMALAKSYSPYAAATATLGENRKQVSHWLEVAMRDLNVQATIDSLNKDDLMRCVEWLVDFALKQKSRAIGAELWAEDVERQLTLAINDMTELAYIIRNLPDSETKCCFACKNNCPDDQYCPGWEGRECFFWRYANYGY